MPLSDFPGTTMTIGGVQVRELFEGSGTGRVTPEDGEADRTFICDWGNLALLATALLGGRTFLNETVTTYAAPASHPDFTNWFCKGLTYDHLGTATVSGTQSAWQYAKIKATFGPFAFDPTTGGGIEDSVEDSVDFGVDAIVVPGATTYDSSQNLVMPEITKVMPLAIYRLRGRGLVRIPGGTGDARGIFSKLGTVNNAEFKGADIGKARFDGAMIRRSAASFDALERARWEVELAWAIRAVEWNKTVWNKTTLALDYPKTVGGADVNVYASANHNELLPQ